MKIEEERELLSNAIKQLVSDDRFHQFMQAIEGLKQAALESACSDTSLEKPGTTCAALGEVRAYLDIQNLVKEYTKTPEQI